MKCENCTEKCPQEELACEIAKGRMYATEEVIRLQKEAEKQKQEIRAKAIDDFAEQLKNRFPITDNGLFTVNDTLHTIIDEIAEKLKGE